MCTRSIMFKHLLIRFSNFIVPANLVFVFFTSGCFHEPTVECDDQSVSWPKDGSTLDTDGDCPLGTKRINNSDTEQTPGKCDVIRKVFEEFDALLTGFGVPEFDLNWTEEAGRKVFFWTSPKNARQVRCGVFVNTPVIEYPQDAEGEKSKGRIKNVSRALRLVRLFNVSPQKVDQADEHRFTLDTLVPPQIENNNCSTESIVTILRLGCWANNSNRIVGATSLIDIQPSDLPEANVPVSDCSVGDEFQMNARQCFISGVGVCKNGVCSDAPTLADSDTEFRNTLDTSQDAGVQGNAKTYYGNEIVSECLLIDAGSGESSEGKGCELPIKFGSCLAGRCCVEESCRTLTINSSSSSALRVIQDCRLSPKMDMDSGDSDKTDTSTTGKNQFYTNGWACPELRYGGFGTCYNGTCRPRCITGVNLPDGLTCNCQSTLKHDMTYPEFIDHQFCKDDPA